MFVKQYDDAALVDAYLCHGSQIPAAKELGCSRETIARAVRRAGIVMTGRKNNGGNGGGSPEKITNAQIVTEAPTTPLDELAKKYGMCPTTLYRRIRRMGIGCRSGSYSGVVGWRRRCNAYGVTEFDDTITMTKLIKRDKGVCQICGLLVDESDKNGRSIGRMYPTLDHIIPISKGGSHTWENVRLAHMGCNAGKCDRLEVSE